MAQITGINLFNFYSLNLTINNKNDKHQIKCKNFPLINKHLQTDTVCFRGNAKEDNTNIDVDKLIADNSKRKYWSHNFSYEDIANIKDKISNKNKRFLPDLLTLNDNALKAENLIEILDYINLEDTNISEFKEKLQRFKKLPNSLSKWDYRPSALPKYVKEIPSQGITDILTSDVLLRVPKNNFNPFSEVYNNIVKVFHEQVQKHCARNNIEVNCDILNKKASEFMRDNFASFLVLGMVFDRSVFNELIYNRGQYIKDIYMPRLRTLSQDDLKILRSVQTDAITDKEDKNGDVVSYEISLDDKISMLNLLSANREIIKSGYKGVKVKDYLRPVNVNNKSGNFVIDFQGLKIDLLDKVLRRIGVEGSIVDKYMTDFKKTYAEEPDLRTHRDKFWDIKYVHLLNAPKGSLLRNIVVATTSGTFDKFLYETGSVAEINKKNKEKFEKAGINYKNWISPTIPPITKEFVDKDKTKVKQFTVKNWNRNPFESLFDGNYTTCCTGLDKNQGASFPHYISNTCTTTLEVRTEKNKVIAMSRILMAKIDGILSMVIENIEVNNKMAKHYLYNDETKYKFREMIFDYARAFAKDINKTYSGIPVYFSANYYKVKDIEKGLGPGQKYYNIDLIGQYPDSIYVNAYGARMDKEKIQCLDDGDEFAFTLSNVTNKAKPIFSEVEKPLTESDYNYADIRDYNGE